MEKIRNLLILMFVLGGCLMSCEEKEGHNLTPQPILKIDKILIDGVEYQYNDTIAVSSANKVEIDYTIEAEGGLTQIQNLYVYGGTANNIKWRQVSLIQQGIPVNWSVMIFFRSYVVSEW